MQLPKHEVVAAWMLLMALVGDSGEEFLGGMHPVPLGLWCTGMGDYCLWRRSRRLNLHYRRISKHAWGSILLA